MDSIALYTLFIFAGIIIIFNVIATYIVFNTYFEVKERKQYQIIFVWCIPFFGATLAIYLNREEYFKNKRKKKIGNLTAISNDDAVVHSLGSEDGP